MAQPKQVRPEQTSQEIRQVATEAVAALKTFIMQNDRDKLTEFIRIFNAHQSDEFLRAFNEEFNREISHDPRVGPIIMAYFNTLGDFEPTEFARFVSVVYDLSDQRDSPEFNARLEERLRTEFGALFNSGMVAERMITSVVVPLLFLHSERREAQGQLQEDALTAARHFVSLLQSRDGDARSRLAQEIREIFERNSAGTGEERNLATGFYDEFMRALTEQSRESAEIVRAYSRDQNITNFRSASMSTLLEGIIPLIVQLRATGSDRRALARRYGRQFVEAVSAYIVMISVPVLEITADSLQRRVEQVREIISEAGLEGLESLFEEWLGRIGRNPSRAEMIALNNEIPTADMMRGLQAQISRSARTISAVIDGESDFYVTMGPRIWIPRMETLVSRLRGMRDDRLLGRFATAMMGRRGINITNLEQLLSSVRMANQDIPQTLSTLDELIRTSPIDAEQSRLDAIGQVFSSGGQISRDIDIITNRIALFYSGIIREENGQITVVDRERWNGIRRTVSRRIMLQFVATESSDPLGVLRQRYESMARSREFISFRSGFTEYIDRYTATLGTASPVTEADRYIAESRRNLAGQARTLFQNIPLEYAYGIYQMLRENYGENWASSLSNPDEMAKICALVVNLSALPPAYGSEVLRRAGRTLLRNYDDASIAVIASAISGYSQAYISGDYYHLLYGYYAVLPEKIRRLFPDVTALQRDRREPTMDVRVRTPPEDPNFANIFLPAANIWVRVPKRIYEQWQAAGFMNIARAPDLTRSPALTPDFLRVMSTFIERPMVEGRVNLPLPFIRLPILLQNIGVLAPDALPPVGEYIAAQISGSGAYTHFRSNETTSDAATITAAETFIREGATTTGRQSYELTEQTGAESTHRGSLDIQNLRLASDYHVRTFSGNFEVIGDRTQTIAGLFSAMAPAGADTFIYFRRREELDGSQSIEAQVFQRLSNGSFVLADTVTLPPTVAADLYRQGFNGPMQRVYGAGRLQTGDVIAQLDGAILFSGPRSPAQEGLPADSTLPQGAGAALQVGEWGGYVDYEHTREGRGAAAFGRFSPGDRSFWFGRVTVENFRTDESGRRRYFAEGAFIEAERTEVRAFVGLSEQPSLESSQGALIINHALGGSFLGMRYIGIGGGRLLREFSGGAREELGGGRIYGVSQDLLNGFVASALYRSYVAAPSPPPSGGGMIDVPPISDGTGSPPDMGMHPELGDSTARPPASLTQMLVSAGVRSEIGREFLLETGGGWDILVNQGGAFLNFDWVPVGDTVSDLGLRAFLVVRGSGDERQYIPIVGGYGEFIAGTTRLIGEAHFPGIGEFRLRDASVELALGGGWIPDVAQGGHGGLRVPVGSRFTLGFAGSGSTDFVEGRTLDQQEGMAGLVFTMPYSEEPGFQLASVFGSISGIRQVEQTAEATRGEALQFDVAAGLNWSTSQSSLSGRLGAQYWEAEWPEEFGSRFAITLGGAYRARAVSLSGDSIIFNPNFTLDTSLGTREVETPTSSTSEVDFRINFGVSGEF